MDLSNKEKNSKKKNWNLRLKFLDFHMNRFYGK